jgi:hypothetical protein
VGESSVRHEQEGGDRDERGSRELRADAHR